jgi:hypothetical protein
MLRVLSRRIQSEVGFQFLCGPIHDCGDESMESLPRLSRFQRVVVVACARSLTHNRATPAARISAIALTAITPSA